MIDSSALVAILLHEEGWERYFHALNTAERRLMAAPTWLEACLVLESRHRGNETVARRLDTLPRDMRIDIVAFDAALAETARSAHRRNGKGSGHPAQLNYGDCMAYALAKHMDEPLLYKGDDFVHTDVTPAIHPDG